MVAEPVSITYWLEVLGTGRTFHLRNIREEDGGRPRPLGDR